MKDTQRPRKIDYIPAAPCDPHQPVTLRIRKRRSDAGKPKAKKQEAPAGVLTEEQVAHIDKLVTAMSNANIAAQNAAQDCANACKAYYDYLDELQGKRP